MPHRKLLRSTCGVEQATNATGLNQSRSSWQNVDTILAWPQANHAQPQGLVPDGQAQSAPPPQPGGNIASTGQRAITAWRSGHRI